MERVTGIGGVFFRAQDPERLAIWYAKYLGVEPAPESYETSSWWQQPGPTVFAAMPNDSDHFGSPERSWSVNFRVADLDAMEAFTAAGGHHDNWEEYDRVMVDQRRTLVLIGPVRIYSN